MAIRPPKAKYRELEEPERKIIDGAMKIFLLWASSSKHPVAVRLLAAGTEEDHRRSLIELLDEGFIKLAIIETKLGWVSYVAEKDEYQAFGPVVLDLSGPERN